MKRSTFLLFLTILSFCLLPPIYASESFHAGPIVNILVCSSEPSISQLAWEIAAEVAQRIDDPILLDRVIVRQQPNLQQVEKLPGIIVYVGHGTPEGILFNSEEIPWNKVRQAISISPSRIHLFACCYSLKAVVQGKLVIGAPGIIDSYLAKVNTIIAILAATGHGEEAHRYAKTVDIEKALDRIINPVKPLARKGRCRGIEFILYSDTYGDIIDYDHPNNYPDGPYSYIGADDSGRVEGLDLIIDHIDRLTTAVLLTVLTATVAGLIEAAVTALIGGPPGWVAAIVMVVIAIIVAIWGWLTWNIIADEQGCAWVFHRVTTVQFGSYRDIWYDFKVGASWWIRTSCGSGQPIFIGQIPDGIHADAGDPYSHMQTID